VKQVRADRMRPDGMRISHPDKILFPDIRLTKADLGRYYSGISGVMLAHLKDRPVSMERFPDGIMGESFYQKEVPDYFPDWIDRISIDLKQGESRTQLVCNSKATLVYLADQACITPHVWLSKANKLDFPDRMIFDLDPPDNDFEIVRKAAKLFHETLVEIGLPSFVMTTGSRGLHVVVPLDCSRRFDRVHSLAKKIADYVAQESPQLLTTEIRKDKRKDRLFVDYLRNSYGQTTVAPYAVRAKPGAPVATPIDWKELSDRRLHSKSYNVGNIFRRLGQKPDPWKTLADKACSAKTQVALEEFSARG
jgi:bifunctional non-homologous end joining protein LigD